jgi:hypothetical protein
MVTRASKKEIIQVYFQNAENRRTAATLASLQMHLSTFFTPRRSVALTSTHAFIDTTPLSQHGYTQAHHSLTSAIYTAQQHQTKLCATSLSTMNTAHKLQVLLLFAVTIY